MINKNVTIVIDGQAGSCGKGKICGYLANKENYEYAVDNWASNAGHTFVSNDDNKIVVQHIPISMVNAKTELIINAGAVITPEILYNEIEKYKDIIGNRKIIINPRAMIIQKKHIQYEKKHLRSGSTFKGGGAAQAEKMMRSEDVILAEEYFKNNKENWNKYVEIKDTASILNEAKGEILIEGSQGQDLDLNYGLKYPYVTSRMCSASQLIADAGITPFKVKDIYMIVRPYPIRISNKTNIGEDIYSGDYDGSKEISWNEISKRCGYDGQLKEYTTVTKKTRRVFEMNWKRLKYNVMINQPTKIVLNFAEYLDWKAYKCRKYDELPQKVIDFCREIENITNTPVVLIGTGEKDEDIVDLR